MPFEFTQDGYRSFQDAILEAGGDQATLTSILADMQATMTESIALVESSKNELAEVQKENDRLRTTNMNLFLQVGEQAKQIDSKRKGQPLAGSEEPPKITTKEYLNDFFKRTGG